MRKSAVMLLALVLAASCLITLSPANADDKTIIVPDDYSTITAAIANATDGDTVLVKRGTYEIKENSITINKTLSIIGEDQTDTIIVFPPDTRTGYELLFSTKVGFRVAADNFKISNLTITNCDYGIQVTGNGVQVSNILTSSISLNGNHCKISESSQIISSSYQYPLRVKGSFNYIVENDNVDIECEGSFNSLIENSGMIEVKGGSNFVARNFVSEISLSNSDFNTVYNNSASTISLRGNNNTVCGNVVKYGISGHYGHYVWGILMGGSDNVLYGNNIMDFNDVSFRDGSPYGYGVAMGGDAERNLFYHNNFVNNYKHVSANWEILGAGNYWDNGEEGNFWDDYSGVDSNGDGIGDVLYTISGVKWDDDASGHVETVFGQDRYPLMVPFDVDSVIVELPEWMSPPSLQLISPENATYTSTDVTLKFTVNKQASWMGYSLDGEDNVTVAGNSTISGLTSGFHNVTVYAKDEFENICASEPVFFTVELPEPFPTTLVAAASGVSVAIIGMGLLVYFKKRNH
jgi:nitrous oxidase accessory protein